jgi:hypothetical protein
MLEYATQFNFTSIFATIREETSCMFLLHATERTSLAVTFESRIQRYLT